MNVKVNKGYESLAGVLQRALDQAQTGKGAERHAQSAPFDQQPMQKLCELYGVGFATGQAAKKAQESARLPAGRDVAELLGAIVYLAGAVIYLERTALTGMAAEVAAIANDNGRSCCLMTGCEAPAACDRACRCLVANPLGAGARG